MAFECSLGGSSQTAAMQTFNKELQATVSNPFRVLKYLLTNTLVKIQSRGKKLCYELEHVSADR